MAHTLYMATASAYVCTRPRAAEFWSTGKWFPWRLRIIYSLHD